MRERLFKPLEIGKGLLSLLALFVMLLAPQRTWAQDPVSYGLTVAGVEVTSANASEITGTYITSSAGSVKYDYANKILTLTNAIIEGSIVRTSDEDLTIHFIGSNTFTTSNSAAIFVHSGTLPSATLSFTQSGNNVSLTVNGMSDSDHMTSGWATTPKIWKACSQTHVYSADQCDWRTTMCSDYIMLAPNYKYDLWVDGSQLCDATWDDYDCLQFNFSSESSALIVSAPEESGSYSPAAIVSSLPSLIVNVSGKALLSSIRFTPKDGVETGTLTIAKYENTDWETNSLTLNNTKDNDPTINGFSSVQVSSPLTLKTPTSTPNWNSYTGEVFISDYVSYGLTVGGVEVTDKNAEDIFNDGINDKAPSVSFTPAVAAVGETPATPATLTLNNATMGSGNQYAVVLGEGISSLNVVLAGENTIESNGFTFVESPATLTFKTNSASPGSLSIAGDDFSLASEGVTVECEDGLYYNDDSKKVSAISMPIISRSLNGLTNKWNVEITNGSQDEGTIKYSLTYADSNLTENDVKNQEYSDPFTLLGPATIKATLTVGDAVSQEATAYYFGILPNPLKFVYDGKTAPTFAATLYPIVDGVTFTPNSSPGNFVTLSDGKFTINGFGSGLAYAYLTYPETKDYVSITDTIGFQMTVVPAAPTINPEGGSCSSDQTITITGTGLANTKIWYKWDNGSAQEYTEAIPVQNGTLTAWEVYTPATGGDGLSSDETTAEYAIEYALDVAFVGSNLWATCYATENLAVPEGLTAYVVSDLGETSATVTDVTYIPKNNAVLLKRASTNADASGYKASAYTGTTTTTNNFLMASTQSVDVSGVNGGTVYVLYNDMFKRATSGTIPAYRGYLISGSMNSQGAPQFMTLNVVEDNSTAISTLSVDDNDDSWYTIDGLQLNGKPQHKGVFIYNRKKIYFKNK